MDPDSGFKQNIQDKSVETIEFSAIFNNFSTKYQASYEYNDLNSIQYTQQKYQKFLKQLKINKRQGFVKVYIHDIVILCIQFL